MDFTAKNIALLGFGREGTSTLRFLLSRGVREDQITILDKNPVSFGHDGIRKITGDSYLDDLSSYDLIIASPGISPYTPEILKYRDRVISQIEIFFSIYSGRVIGITATKGKSTTSTLLYNVIQKSGKSVELVGNIGKPVLESIDFEDPPEYVVYEMSSYMLEYAHPRLYIALLGNIYPDHLDYHHGFENYKNAKLSILRDTAYSIVGEQVLPYYEDPKPPDIIIPSHAGYHLGDDGLYFGETLLMRRDEIHLLGEHNEKNILSVFAACDFLGIDRAITRTTIGAFRGLPHRLEYVGRYADIDFYDDAISTTPESTIAGIRALSGRTDTIFLGGEDRGYDFRELASVLREEKIRNIVLFPNSGKNILAHLDIEIFDILETSSMEEAVSFGYEKTKKGFICLLSTASPSYSLWKNFEEKGDEFQKYIKNASL